MEEESSILESLIQQHANHKSYNRMVSWEFSQPKEEPNFKKGKTSRHDSKDIVSEIEELNISEENSCESGTESIDSEYFSAEDTFDSSGSDNEDVIDHNEVEQCAAENVIASGSTQRHTSEMNKRERKGSSKRQKRMRKLYRMEDLTIPFSNSDSLDLTLPTDILESSLISIEKQIPSLTELCLRSIQTKSKAVPPTNDLPPLLKRMMHVQRNNKKLESVQISWLHRTLAYIESVPNNFFNEKEANPKKDKHYESRGEWRNIETLTYDDVWNAQNQQVAGFQMGTFTLPIYHKSRSKEVNYYSNNNRNNNYNNIIYALSVLAQTIDLMLPCVLGDNVASKNPSQSEEERMKKAELTMTIRVKMALNARYPRVIDCLYDGAMAYVWWARGDIAKASQCFLYLAENHKHARTRAMYFNELGRLYTQNGDCNKASRFFYAAKDAVLSNSKYARNAGDIQAQCLTLAANAMDTGLLSVGKARKAAQAWDVALKADVVYDATVQYAAESALRCFSGYSLDPSLNWHKVVKERLNDIATKHECPFYHLAIVNAMLGSEKDSSDCYRYIGANYHMFNDDSEPLTNPYAAILDAAKVQGHIEPMKMLWRTTMCHPVISQRNITNIEVGHFCSDTLNLRINDSGYLTGDIQMVLPPIQAVQIDPYTGLPVYPQTPAASEPWYDLHINEGLVRDADNVELPKLHLLYSDDRDVKVHIFIATCYSQDHTGGNTPSLTNHCAMVYYDKPGGERVKLDLRKIARLQMKLAIEDKIRKECDTNGYMSSINWQKDMLAMVEKHYKNGWSLSYDEMKYCVKDLYVERETLAKERLKKEKEKTGPKSSKKKQGPKFRRSRYHYYKAAQKKNKDKPQGFSLVLLDYRVYGRTLLLFLRASTRPVTFDRVRGGEHTNIADMIMFINCDNGESFSAPTTHCKVTPFVDGWSLDPERMVPRSPRSEVKVFPDAETFTLKCLQCLENTKKKSAVTFDKNGEILESGERVLKETFDFTDVIGDTMFAMIDREPNRVTGYSIKRGRYSNETIEPVAIKCAHKLVFTLTTEGLVILLPESLQPVTMTTSKLFTEADKLSDDRTFFQGTYRNMHVIKSSTAMHPNAGNVEVVRCILSLDSLVIVLQIPIVNQCSPSCVELMQSVKVSGQPIDAAFIPDGFLITATLNRDSDTLYREHLYRFSTENKLVSLLPCLGRGPHSFTTTFLTEDNELRQKYEHLNNGLGEEGHYTFFSDGHGAICCINTSRQ
ncbi:unnamed protein product [Owenia fusiformis]|uniref:Uncharacterized protein n=1 Tax=Owenia fusiformis TaxID=6347 RepID=A0A8J1XFC2_OWEFU|nr:unnamed protein product [Owenia fusiformis]